MFAHKLVKRNPQMTILDENIDVISKILTFMMLEVSRG